MANKQSKKPDTYAASGVSYDLMDPFKRLAQLRAKATTKNLSRFGMAEVSASRGESAYVWEEPDSFRAFVIEGLGTKNLVADETRQFSGKTHYDSIAQDTVAMIVNDLIVVGADPQIINAYFAVGDSRWFADEDRVKDLIEGWAQACHLAAAVWGGGETPTLKSIIEPETIDLSGSAVGIIKPKDRLVLGDKLTPGDAIVVIESSGIHANGLTLARAIAAKLPDGYATRLPDGSSYGEALLTPTHIYAGLIQDLFEAGIEIHYMVNITGHGWRKLMRADRELSYKITKLPPVQPVFQFIQKHSRTTDEEMYGNFNMGAGFAIFVPAKQAAAICTIALKKHGFAATIAGRVAAGPRQVSIKQKNIVFHSQTLGVR